MSYADALKLERDGHLFYGKPNAHRIMVAKCIANDHDEEWIEYGDGSGRCMKCLTVVPPLGKGVHELSDRRDRE